MTAGCRHPTLVVDQPLAPLSFQKALGQLRPTVSQRGYQGHFRKQAPWHSMSPVQVGQLSLLGTTRVGEPLISLEQH
jgi:hypothetical protein